jgi:spermidine synthase
MIASQEPAVGPSNLSYLASAPSPFGTLHLRRRELLAQPGIVVLELLVDQELLMSSLSTHSEQALAQRAIQMRGRGGLDVLVGGLGLGFTARAALDSDDVARVEVIELLPELISWFQSGLIPLGHELGRDPRFSLRQGDVYETLAGPAPDHRYDVILIDVDHAPEEHLGDASDSFYTEATLQKAREHLAPDGILGVWSYAESTAFAALLRRVFRDVRVQQLQFTNPVLEEEESNWLFLARR